MQLRRFRATAIAIVLGTVGASEGVAWQLGSRSAEGWIETLGRPERVKRLQIDEVIARLRIKPGDILTDIGAGAGVFSLPFARAVAPGGKVYAVEVDQGLVDHIAEKVRTEGVSNVETVLGEFTDPNLPTQDIDLAFFHDVLHHVKERADYLKNLARYIKPEGRIAIIERGHTRPDQHEMHMSQEQVTAWMADVGFQPSEEHFLFEGGKWFVVYSRR